MKFFKLCFAIVFSVFFMLIGCTQKTHFKFEKINNISFTEKTKSFSFNNLLYVICNDQFVCIDPETGVFLESVNLPGYPTDYGSFGYFDSNVGFIYNTPDGYSFNYYKLNPEKPYFTKSKSMAVLGSKFDDSFYSGYKDEYQFIISDTKSNTLSWYSNFHLVGDLKFDFPVKVKFLKSIENTLVVYDGKKVTYASIVGKDTISYPANLNIDPDNEEDQTSIQYTEFNIKAVNFDKSFIVDYFDHFAIYDGESFNCVVDEKKIDEINVFRIIRYRVVQKKYPNVTGHFGEFITTNNGLFNLESDTLITDNKVSIVDIGRAASFSLDNICSRYELHLGLSKLDDKTKVICYKNLPYYSTINNNGMIPEFSFDYLPKGASNIKIVDFRNDYNRNSRHKLKVYAFTEQGLYRSEAIAEYSIVNP